MGWIKIGHVELCSKFVVLGIWFLKFDKPYTKSDCQVICVEQISSCKLLYFKSVSKKLQLS